MFLSFFICVFIFIASIVVCTYLFYKNKNLSQKLIQNEDELNRKNIELNEKNIELAKIQGQLENYKNQEEWFKKQQDIQKEIFQNLSNKALEEQNKKGSEKIYEILKPFEEQLTKCKDAVDKVNGETKTQINTKIDEMFKYTQEVGKSADRLAKAFKGDKKAQGNFGEMQFKNLLNSYGFTENVDYFYQYSLKIEAEKNKYPDFILQVKPDEWLVVDSKFSLSNYEQYVNEDDKGKKQQFLEAYVKDLKNRIKELGDKEYFKLLKKNGKNTCDFVCLFFGNEMAYLTAISNAKYREEIFELSREKQVAIVTSSSFTPVLQMIKYLWKIEKSNKNIEEAVRKINVFYNKLVRFFESLSEMDKKLGNALDLYKEAKKYLYNGNQNITRTVDEINKLIGAEKKNDVFLKFDEREKENDDYCLNGNDDTNNDYDENNNDDDL